MAGLLSNKTELVAVKDDCGLLLLHAHSQAKPIYEVLLSANKSLGFSWDSAAAENVDICI